MNEGKEAWTRACDPQALKAHLLLAKRSLSLGTALSSSLKANQEIYLICRVSSCPSFNTQLGRPEVTRTSERSLWLLGETAEWAPCCPELFYMGARIKTEVKIKPSSWNVNVGVFFFLSFFFLLFRAEPVAYGGSQARGLIGATAASLCHSHSNARSEPHL